MLIFNNYAIMKVLFTALYLAAMCVPASAAGEGEEDFLDGYDHSVQEYLTNRLAGGSQASGEQTVVTEKKKWKIDDFVTVPKFGGYIIGMFDYKSTTGKDDSNQFSLRMLRLYVDGTVFKDFKYRVQMEVSGQPGQYDKDGNAQAGYGPRVVDAYVDWCRFSWLGIKGGQFKRCFTFENPMNPWDLSNGDYTQLTKFMTNLGTRTSGNYAYNHNSGGRDLGVQLHGDLFKNEKTGHYYLSYQLGMYNGQGINVGDKDKEKDYIGNVQVQPLKGWKIGVFGWHGSFYGYNAGLDMPQYSQYFNRWCVGTSYEGKRLSVRSEYARNHNTYPDKTVSDAWNITVGYNVWRWLKPFVRYDALHTDVDTWSSLNSIYGMGLQARPHKNLQFQLQYNYAHDNKSHADTHQVWTQAYIRF